MNDLNIRAKLNATDNFILKEMIGSAMYFSNWREYSALLEEKLRLLSGWDMIKIAEFSISRGCFISRDIPGLFSDREVLNFYSASSPVIQETYKSHDVILRKFNKVETPEQYEKKLMMEGYKNANLISILVREKFVGVLACFSKSGEALSARDISLMNIVAELLAITQEMFYFRKRMNENQKTIVDYEEAFIELESAKIMENLSSGITFEINNLLSGILEQAEMLERQADKSQQRLLIEEIKQSILTGREAIKNLEEFKKLHMEREFSIVEIDKILKKAVELTKPKWRDEAWARNIEYKFEMDIRQVSPVMGSTSALLEAFITIIFKLLETIRDGGKIIISTSGEHDSVQISFDASREMEHQFGIGTFDPCFPVWEGSKVVPNISAATKIIKRHYGNIEIGNKSGSGAVITINLPAIEDGNRDLDKKARIITKSTANILVVEDDQTVRSLLKDVLEVEGFNVTTALSGSRALEILKRDEFDVLMTDLEMPQMSGYELAAEVRKMYPKLAIILAADWESRIDKGKIKQGLFDYIVEKPFLFSEIFEVIMKCLFKTREKIK